MSTQQIKNLPFWETIGRSFKYALKNKTLLKSVLPIIVILLILQMIMNNPFVCVFQKNACTTDWRYYVTLASFVMAAVIIIINYCRTIVCKVDIDYKSIQFWKRATYYLLAKMGMLFIISVPSLLSVLLIVYISEVTNVLWISIILLIPLFFCIIFAPLFLLFPAVSVEDFNLLKIRKLFQLAKGNHNAIFWSQLIISMPYWILFRACMEIYQVVGLSNYIINSVFVLIGIVISVIDSCFKGAYFAHLYQFFKFYDTEK